MKINKRFQEYIDKKNFWCKFTKQPTIEFPLTQANVHSLVCSLESDLSPENLCCDGEISAKQARARGNKLSNIAKDLENYANKNNLHATWNEY